MYSVFRLDSNPFIPQVEQHKLDLCSMDGLFKTLQGLCYRHLNFSFSKNLQQFSENSNSKTKNGRNVQFAPKSSKYNVVFLVKKIRAIDGVGREI